MTASYLFMNALSAGRATSLTIKFCLMLILLPFLTGCYEVAPQKVQKTISIQRSGQVSVEYSGTFKDLSELLKELGDNVDDTEAETLEKLKDTDDVQEVRRVGPHLFFARWQAKGNFNTDRLPALIGGPSGVSLKAPILVKFKTLRDLQQGFAIADYDADELKDLEQLANDAGGSQAVKGYLRDFSGTLIIDIDDDLVLESNAPTKKKIAHDRTRHQWEIRIPIEHPVKFSFSLDKSDHVMQKILSAAPGTDCTQLIGSKCMCGPFLLTGRGPGSAKVNTAYEILTEGGITRGCTNEKGETATVPVDRTGGPCKLTLPEGAAAAGLCGK